jgi:hypothetical protein
LRTSEQQHQPSSFVQTLIAPVFLALPVAN